jgi:hypothetical protein
MSLSDDMIEWFLNDHGQAICRPCAEKGCEVQHGAAVMPFEPVKESD